MIKLYNLNYLSIIIVCNFKSYKQLIFASYTADSKVTNYSSFYYNLQIPNLGSINFCVNCRFQSNKLFVILL